jgi:hypothetical protein
MTTNLINGKIYIGQHQGKKFNPKYLGSGYGYGIVPAIKKYGKDNFSVEIIHRCDSFSMMDQKEIYYIKRYDSANKEIGYNIALGGDVPMRGRKHSKKSRIKMSIGLKKIFGTKEYREANSKRENK